MIQRAKQTENRAPKSYRLPCLTEEEIDLLLAEEVGAAETIYDVDDAILSWRLRLLRDENDE